MAGTSGGVFKVGTITQKPDGEQRSFDNVQNFVGSPQQPRLGVDNRRITKFARKKLEGKDRSQPQYQFPSQFRNVRIQCGDAGKYGRTDGCVVCRAVVAGNPWRAAHSVECRQRMEKAMSENFEAKSRVDQAAETISHYIADNSEIGFRVTPESEPPRPLIKSKWKLRCAHRSERQLAAAQAESTPAPVPGGDGGTAAASQIRNLNDSLVQRLRHAAAAQHAEMDDPRSGGGQEVEGVYDQVSRQKTSVGTGADDSARGDTSSLEHNHCGVQLFFRFVL